MFKEALRYRRRFGRQSERRPNFAHRRQFQLGVSRHDCPIAHSWNSRAQRTPSSVTVQCSSLSPPPALKHSAKYERRLNPGTSSQFDISDTPLGLQTLQDSTVYRVEFDPPHPMRPLQIAGS